MQKLEWQVFVGNADLSQAVHGKNRSSGPSSPGTLPANEFGLVDVRGNIWEWTTTDYSSNPAKGKALLGGSFVSSGFIVMNPDARFYGALDNTYFQYGFRVVLATVSAQNQE